MENVIGYDEYEKDFENVALPEYKVIAWKKFLDELDIWEPGDNLEVYLEAAMSIDDLDHTFRFSCCPEQMEDNLGRFEEKLVYIGEC